MKLTIYNCSPKPGNNNTGVMLESFIKGFKANPENEVIEFRLNKAAAVDSAVKAFESAEAVLIAFPLYCYAMPGGVKLFFEALQPLCGQCQSKKIAFLVQYGFFEAIHARPLEKYLVKLAALLGCEYLGTIIKGGCDGLASGKGIGKKKILAGIYQIGLTLGKTGTFDSEQLLAYSAPEIIRKKSVTAMKWGLGFINKYYWGRMLKKNGVSVEASFARPYQVER